MRVLLQPVFILHRRPYRNTSLLLDAFSPDHGRMGLAARGAAAPRSRLKGLLQPFTPLLLSWSGAGDLATLTGAEDAGLPIALPPHRVLAGLYVNELLMRLLRRLDPQTGLFTAYRTLLTELATAPNEEPVLRRFEKQLLDELGYGLNLIAKRSAASPSSPRRRIVTCWIKGHWQRVAMKTASPFPAKACWPCATGCLPIRRCCGKLSA